MLYFKLFLLFFVAFAIAKNDCPKGSFLSESSPSNCYIFQKEKLNWNNAGKVCEKFGGHLTFPQDLFEAFLFGSRASNMSFTDFWIGSNNFVNSSIWTYSDGSPFKYETWLIWDESEPKNPNNQRCAAVTASSKKWKSSDCSDLKQFLCEIERYIPSNEWIPFNATGYQYKVFNYTTTWKIAQLICKQENSNLISIHSKQEMIFATVILKPYTLKNDFDSCLFQSQTWIGLFTEDNHNSWMWLDTSPYNDSIHKELWAPNEPDNPGLQNCGNIWNQSPCDPYVQLKFYNHDCSLLMDHFICKKSI